MIKSIRAVTLLEILTVIIIIGILVALALPNFGTMKERALDREAKANLKLIQAAEKIYRMEAGFYYPKDADNFETNIGTINTNLRLSLTERNWDYSVTGGDPGTATPEAGSATAARTGVSGSWTRTYYIRVKDDGSEEACCCPDGDAPDSVCPSQDHCQNEYGYGCPPSWHQ